MQIAAPRTDSLDLAEGHCMLAYAAWWQGDVTVTRDHSLESIALYDPDRHLAAIASFNQNPRITSGYLHALSNWVIGHPTRAVEAMESTLAHARELKHPSSVGTALLFFAQLRQLRREPRPREVACGRGHGHRHRPRSARPVPVVSVAPRLGARAAG